MQKSNHVSLLADELVEAMLKATEFRMVTPMVGVASGDDERISVMYGLWSSGFTSSAQQRSSTTEHRYKVQQRGAVIGTDTLINENYLRGIAYSNSALVRKYSATENIKDIKNMSQFSKDNHSI